MPVALVRGPRAGTVVAYIYSPVRWLPPSLRLSWSGRCSGSASVSRPEPRPARPRLTVASLVGAVGGFTVARVLRLRSRLLSVPKTVSTSLGEVTFPAFSRLMATARTPGLSWSERPRPVLDHQSFAIAPLVAASPALIPFLFGHRWKEASLMLPGLGNQPDDRRPDRLDDGQYLYATGDAKTPLWIRRPQQRGHGRLRRRGGILFGTVGLGMGVAAGQMVTIPQLLIRVRRSGGPSLWRPCLGPAVCASVAMGVGWWLCRTLSDTLLGGLAASPSPPPSKCCSLWSRTGPRCSRPTGRCGRRRVLIPARVSARLSGASPDRAGERPQVAIRRPLIGHGTIMGSRRRRRISDARAGHRRLRLCRIACQPSAGPGRATTSPWSTTCRSGSVDNMRDGLPQPIPVVQADVRDTGALTRAMRAPDQTWSFTSRRCISSPRANRIHSARSA